MSPEAFPKPDVAGLRRAGNIVYFNQPQARRTLRCLWISRDIPFPQDAGDKIYSANMACALAEASVSICFLGYANDAPDNVPESWSANWPIETSALAGNKRNKFAALFDRLPIAAAIHATPQYRTALENQLGERWDLIVIDSYGSGWALDACLAAQDDAVTRGATRPTLVYLSHNHEESIWRAMATQGKGGFPRRFALWQNYRKVRALERRLAAKVDLISAITEEDAQTYARQQPGKPTVALTPGYSGWSVPQRTITAATPRHVVLVGSFRWAIKQENLRRFLELADARFKAHDIRFDVIGDVPRPLLDELRPQMQATQFHGFVDDIAPYLDAARLAVVPEVIGGGFKLKYLDYLFARVPIATIGEAAAGLPQSIRDNMICCDDLVQLVDAIIETMDQTGRLNTMQEQAFAGAHALFDWKDRGIALRKATEALVDEKSTRLAAFVGSPYWPQTMPPAIPPAQESRT